MIGNAVIGQSGGPTTVINASLAGVIDAAGRSRSVRRLLGLHFGIEGCLEEDFWDLSAMSPSEILSLRAAPSSALGSSRYKLREEDLPRVLHILKKYDVRYFFLIGGNDTMDTIHRVEAYCRKEGYDLKGVGIPKTVDNDLYGTDHTPGFPSSARANILNVRQAGILARDMRKVDKFVVYQTVGRNAGWLAASTALARDGEGSAPHLIYCSERPFQKERFLSDFDACLRRYGWVFIVAGEGLLWEDGTPVGSSMAADSFNNTEYGAAGSGSAALNLHRIISAEFGLRGEFQIPESLVMCAMDRAEPGDLDRAYGLGREAVRIAEEGGSGVMVTITRKGAEGFGTGTAVLGEVAARAKVLPADYINGPGNDVTPAFLDYLRPLISPLPAYADLERSCRKLPKAAGASGICP
jgi:6-phosphofructokinase 1